jgi:hypothetical protein
MEGIVRVTFTMLTVSSFALPSFVVSQFTYKPPSLSPPSANNSKWTYANNGWPPGNVGLA